MHKAQEKLRKRELDVNMCILTDELIEEILVREPQEELPKLKFVSKSWQTLIDSPEFKQLRSLRFGTRFIFQDAANCKIYVTGCLDSPERMKATKAELENHPFPSSKTFFPGSCNGVICRLNSSSGNFVLWNPNTNQHLELPPSPPSSVYGHNNYYGLGYDDGRDDYKVVRLVQLDKGYKQQFQVYGLKSNSWKNLPEGPPYYIPSSFSTLGFKGVFAKNFLHWLMRKKWKYLENAIVALDLTTEKFHLVPLPQLEEIDMSIKLHVLDGCLCLMVSEHYCLNASGEADLWMMMKYGAQNSWTKLTVRLSGEAGSFKVWSLVQLKPIMCSRGSGNTYVVFQYYGYLVWYDINKGLVHEAVSIGAREEGHVVDCNRAILHKGSV